MLSSYDPFRYDPGWGLMEDWTPHHLRRSMMNERLASFGDEGIQVINDRHKYAVQMDVRQYKPEEITVRVHNETDIPYVSIHASHEERLDNHGGHVSRQFSRRYTLPSDVDANHVQCDLSNNGILTMQAPKRSRALDEGGARSIPITMVDKPAKLTHAGEPEEEKKK